MIPNKLNKKYYLPIWLGIIFATAVCNLYSLIANFSVIAQESATNLERAVDIVYVLLDALLPAALCFVYALAVYQVGFARYVRCISRADFCYLTALHIACSRLVMGIFNIFSLIDPALDLYFTGMLSVLCNGLAMFFMFFFTFKRFYNFNPVERYRAFSAWGTMFMIGGGVKALLANGALLLVSDDLALMRDVFGYDLTSGDMKVFSAGLITGMCIFGAYIIAMIVLGVLLKKEAGKFQNPATRADYYNTHSNAPYNMRSDAGDVFGDDPDLGGKDGGDDNVFDEFDL